MFSQEGDSLTVKKPSTIDKANTSTALFYEDYAHSPIHTLLIHTNTCRRVSTLFYLAKFGKKEINLAFTHYPFVLQTSTFNKFNHLQFLYVYNLFVRNLSTIYPPTNHHPQFFYTNIIHKIMSLEFCLKILFT